ncbi:FUSC family protein [Clostridia bacterium OttesenSCG-928-O13]|nr:FUSC family protein [Clostridia bacterium OttesenSCG-928-O13]
MTRLEEDVHIAQLLELYKTHSRQGGAQDLMAVLGYVALMEKQLAAVSEELRGVRQELAALRQPGPVAVERQKLADRLDDAVQTARKQLDSVRQSILQWAKDTLAAVKQAGVTALDGAVRALHIRDGLETASTGLKNAAADVDRTAGRIAAINARHREASMHLRNFGRAIRGREPLAQAKPEGKLSRGAQSVFSGVRNVLAGIARDADAAIDRLAKLEQAAKPSILDNLRSLKETTAKAAPAPAPGKVQDMSL